MILLGMERQNKTQYSRFVHSPTVLEGYIPPGGPSEALSHVPDSTFGSSVEDWGDVGCVGGAVSK